MSSRHRNLYFTETFLKSLFAKYTKKSIYDFDLAGVTGANKLRKRYPTSFLVKFVSTKRMTMEKLKLLIKISQTSQ
jgi:hypothetical protein